MLLPFYFAAFEKFKLLFLDLYDLDLTRVWVEFKIHVLILSVCCLLMFAVSLVEEEVYIIPLFRGSLMYICFS